MAPPIRPRGDLFGRCAELFVFLATLGGGAAVGGSVTYPGPGDASIQARSAALGDPIQPGSFRYYQVYYRDPDPNFCSLSQSTFNASNAVMVRW